MDQVTNSDYIHTQFKLSTYGAISILRIKAYTNLTESAVTMNTCKEFSFPYVLMKFGEVHKGKL